MDAYLREATEKDTNILFCWVNDPAVRESAFSTKKISYKEHTEWYNIFLKRTDCKQYIYMYDNEAVGQARVEICQNEAEIDYSICREKRHMGHGKKLLKLLCIQVRIDFPDVQKLTARVKTDNIASQRAFITAGYTEKFTLFELNISNMK